MDWTVGGSEIYAKPVAWINASSGAAPTGGADAHASLAKVLGYVGADIVEAAFVCMPMTRQAVGPEGLITDPDLVDVVAAVLRTLVSHTVEADGRHVDQR